MQADAVLTQLSCLLQKKAQSAERQHWVRCYSVALQLSLFR